MVPPAMLRAMPNAARVCSAPRPKAFDAMAAAPRQFAVPFPSKHPKGSNRVASVRRQAMSSPRSMASRKSLPDMAFHSASAKVAGTVVLVT